MITMFSLKDWTKIKVIFVMLQVAFPLLEELVIDGCDNTGHLERISQDEIQNSFQPATCFSRLTILFISSCSKMKYLFCNNIAENLLQLQELSVYSCGSMEGIITNKGTSDGKIINFSKLKILMLSGMPKLASFYVDLHSTSTLSTDPSAGYQDFFDGMVGCFLTTKFLWNDVTWHVSNFNWRYILMQAEFNFIIKKIIEYLEILTPPLRYLKLFFSYILIIFFLHSNQKNIHINFINYKTFKLFWFYMQFKSIKLYIIFLCVQ